MTNRLTTIDQGILEKTLEFAPREWLLSSYIATGIDRNVTDQLAKRQEYFLYDVKLAKDRLLMAKKYNLRTINSEDASYTEKTEALKLFLLSFLVCIISKTRF